MDQTPEKNDSHFESERCRFNLHHHTDADFDIWAVSLIPKNTPEKDTFSLHAFSQKDFVTQFIPWLAQISTISPEHFQACLDVTRRTGQLFPDTLASEFNDHINKCKTSK